MTISVIDLLRRYAYTLEPSERRRVLDWLRHAERLLTPPRTIAYARFTDPQERRRRANLSRPNTYYPGESDFGGAA